MRSQTGEHVTFDFGDTPLELHLGATHEEAGVGSQLWDASVALSLFLRSGHLSLSPSSRVVELGAGIGLPSLDLARRPDHPAHITLTDARQKLLSLALRTSTRFVRTTCRSPRSSTWRRCSGATRRAITTFRPRRRCRRRHRFRHLLRRSLRRSARRAARAPRRAAHAAHRPRRPLVVRAAAPAPQGVVDAAHRGAPPLPRLQQRRRPPARHRALRRRAQRRIVRRDDGAASSA